MKLTEAQLNLLTHAVAAGKATCAEYYTPRRKLAELGFVTEHEGKFSSWIEPTEAGRRVLEQSQSQEGK